MSARLRAPPAGPVLAAAVLVVGAVLEPGPDAVALGGMSLPSTCLLRSVLPGGCPGCGWTRSVVLTCHLRPVEAAACHPGGPLLVGLAAASLVRSVVRPGRRSRDRVDPWEKAGRLLLAGAFLAGAAAWVIRLLDGRS